MLVSIDHWDSLMYSIHELVHVNLSHESMNNKNLCAYR